MISQRRKVYDSFKKHGPCGCTVVAEHLKLTPEQVRKAVYTMVTLGCMENRGPGRHLAEFAIVEGVAPPERRYNPATARKRAVVAAPKVVDSCLLAECLKNWRVA